MMIDSDSVTLKDVVKSKHWREAMMSEMEAIERNHTWELTILPNGVTPIGVKWVFKTKLDANGQVEKYKARFVAKGYAQRHRIDYTKVFAAVARLDTVRVILATTVQFTWTSFQLDVKSSFLHGELKEAVYV